MIPILLVHQVIVIQHGGAALRTVTNTGRGNSLIGLTFPEPTPREVEIAIVRAHLRALEMN